MLIWSPQRCFLLAAGAVTSVILPCSSSGKALPQGGAGAVRDHEEVCPDPGAGGARQVHREPRAWVPLCTNTHTHGACIISCLNRSLSWRAGGGFSPPPPSSHLRKTNPFVVWCVEWAAEWGFFPLSSSFGFTADWTFCSVLEVIFFFIWGPLFIYWDSVLGKE